VYAFFVYQHAGLRTQFENRVKSMLDQDQAYGAQRSSLLFSKAVSRNLEELDEAAPEISVRNYIPG
jgi:hypothetical protein